MVTLEAAIEIALTRLKSWPIDDHEHCMCGSTVESHNIGSGHAPVSMGDYSLDTIIEGLQEALNENRR